MRQIRSSVFPSNELSLVVGPQSMKGEGISQHLTLGQAQSAMESPEEQPTRMVGGRGWERI
jgi:hypothetical protein